MKFIYHYRSSDNVKCVGELSAATKDAAYARLRTQGIRPERVLEAPGYLNKLFGKGKRWIAIVVLSLLCVFLIGLIVRNWAAGEGVVVTSARDFIGDTTRRQVIGDAMVIELGIRTGWSSVFSEEGERFLASFAIPGVPAGQRSTTEEELVAALSRRVLPEKGESIESSQIKYMVEGMKTELRDFVQAGGSLLMYGKRLVERQEAEIAIRERMKNELATMKKAGMDKNELESYWERQNQELRQMGIKLIPYPGNGNGEEL